MGGIAGRVKAREPTRNFQCELKRSPEVHDQRAKDCKLWKKKTKGVEERSRHWNVCLTRCPRERPEGLTWRRQTNTRHNFPEADGNWQKGLTDPWPTSRHSHEKPEHVAQSFQRGKHKNRLQFQVRITLTPVCQLCWKTIELCLQSSVGMKETLWTMHRLRNPLWDSSLESERKETHSSKPLCLGPFWHGCLSFSLRIQPRRTPCLLYIDCRDHQQYKLF